MYFHICVIWYAVQKTNICMLCCICKHMLTHDVQIHADHSKVLITLAAAKAMGTHSSISRDPRTWRNPVLSISIGFLLLLVSLDLPFSLSLSLSLAETHRLEAALNWKNVLRQLSFLICGQCCTMERKARDKQG